MKPWMHIAGWLMIFSSVLAVIIGLIRRDYPEKSKGYLITEIRLDEPTDATREARRKAAQEMVDDRNRFMDEIIWGHSPNVPRKKSET